jgi:hypothetical protein
VPAAPDLIHGIAFRIVDADFSGGYGTHAQLVCHHLQPRQRTHARNHRQIGDRFGEKLVGACLQPARTVGGLIERGYHHHRKI